MDPVDNNSTITTYDFENMIYQAEDEGDEDCEIPGKLFRLLVQEEKVIQPHEETVEVVKLGSETNRKEVNIGDNLEVNVNNKLIQMLHEYIDIFAWSYEDMPGLDTDVVVHRLPMKEGCAPIK